LKRLLVCTSTNQHTPFQTALTPFHITNFHKLLIIRRLRFSRGEGWRIFSIFIFWKHPSIKIGKTSSSGWY
jgi:hypothetical protein